MVGRILRAALAAFLLLAAPAWAQSVAPVDVVWSYRDDFARGVRWTPGQVIDLLRTRPYVTTGNLDGGYPVGSPVLLMVGAQVRGWKAAGVDPARVCVNWRPDLFYPIRDGSRATLMNEPICPASGCSRVEGDARADWGSWSGAFSWDWMLRTKDWERVVAESWGGRDFCEDQIHSWGAVIDREAICSRAEPGAHPYIYGTSSAGALTSVSGVGLDLRIPAARTWQARQVLSKLLDQGFEAGDGACIILGLKSGLWTHYTGPNPARPCPAPGANSWSGYETATNQPTCWGGGFFPTPYGPGEFEAAISATVREVWRVAGLKMPRRGRTDTSESWGTIDVMTLDRPATRGIEWWIFDDDVRRRLVAPVRNVPSGL